MKKDLKQVQDVLLKLQHQVEEKKRIWSQFDIHNSQDKLRQEIAYSYLYFDTDFADLMACDQEGYRVSEEVEWAKNQKALPFYDEWIQLELDIHDRPRYIITAPNETETLQEYLVGLSEKIYAQKGCTSNFGNSVRSLVWYLHETLEEGQAGFLEGVFPKKMDISDEGIIMRKIRPQVPPVDIFVAATIVEEFMKVVLHGRSDSQFAAAEVLAFLFICLTSGRVRFPTTQQLLHSFDMSNSENAIKSLENSSKVLLSVPTLCGIIEVPVSQMLLEYLLALTKMNSDALSDRSIKRSLKAMRVVFNGVISHVPGLWRYGEISLMTFMTFPHFHSNCRFSPN